MNDDYGTQEPFDCTPPPDALPPSGGAQVEPHHRQAPLVGVDQDLAKIDAAEVWNRQDVSRDRRARKWIACPSNLPHDGGIDRPRTEEPAEPRPACRHRIAEEEAVTVFGNERPILHGTEKRIHRDVLDEGLGVQLDNEWPPGNRDPLDERLIRIDSRRRSRGLSTNSVIGDVLSGARSRTESGRRS